MDHLLPYKYNNETTESKPCPLCDNEISEIMLKCKECKHLFHSDCVNVQRLTRSVDEWECPNCKAKREIIINSSKLIEENKKLKAKLDRMSEKPVESAKLKDLERQIQELSMGKDKIKELNAQIIDQTKKVENLESELTALEAENGDLKNKAPDGTGISNPDILVEVMTKTIAETLKQCSLFNQSTNTWPNKNT